MKINLKYISAMTLLLSAFYASAQEKDLGGELYTILKPYKPVLAESFKISDTPEGDTSSATAPTLNYNPEPKKLETNYETGVIKAVKIKDEPIAKLYRSLLKLGIGNYTHYLGELYINSLRSKTGEFGFHAKHFSGSPNLSNAGTADYSENTGNIYGKYFLENATLSGDLNYMRDAVHYYGYSALDSIIDGDSTKQVFNNFDFGVGLKSNWLTNDHLNYDVNFRFSTISDFYNAKENDFVLSGMLGKKVNSNNYSLLASFDYFKKSNADFEKLDINSNEPRNIITVQPQMTFDKNKVHLLFGVAIAFEKNVGTKTHLFPKVEVSVPVAEHVLNIFATVDGNIQKNTFKTLTDENPFLTSAVKLSRNTINKLVFAGGLKGNFSNKISFTAAVKYSSVRDMVFFYSDSNSFSKFNILYSDADVLNVHAEVAYHNSEKLNIAFHFDQYDYSGISNADVIKPWHKPMTEVRFVTKYNLQDKIIATLVVLGRGKEYLHIAENNSILVNEGYVDFNLGLEYRFSKVLSFYTNINNISFNREYRWYQYPSERFNMMGGVTYAF